MKIGNKQLNLASVTLGDSKIKKEIFCSFLSICIYYFFKKTLFVENVFELLGGKAVVVFNTCDFLGISLEKYIERLGVIVFFTSLYVMFCGLYALLFSSGLFFGKEVGFRVAAAGVRNKGIFMVFALFLFKIFQVIVWTLIIIGIDGDKSVLDNFALFVAVIVGSFVLGEMILSSVFSFRFLLNLICNKGRFL